MEYRLRYYSGEYRWILDIGVPRFNQDGSFAGYIGIGVDVTDRKRAEEELRESEERFRLAAQAGKMYAYEWDPRSDVVTRSEEYVNILGLGDPKEQFTRQQLAARVHPDDRARFVSSVDQLTPENPTTQISYRVLRHDGSVIWLEKSGRAFFDAQGSPVRMMGMVSDISERKRAEEALRTSEERLRLAQQAAHIGTFEWNVQTGVNSWTPELEAMYGLPPGGFGGTQEAFENLVHPDDRARVVELVNDSMKTGQPTKGEWRIIWSDGSVHWVAGSWQVLLNESGEPLRMVGVNIEVTERKWAEEALSGVNRRLIEAQEQERMRIGRELHDDINQRLAMLAVELEQLQQNPSEVQSRLRKLLEETSEISSDVEALSHELHSSKLQYLGVVAGIRSWCREFGERQNMEIDFRSDVASVLPLEIGVCLFRVLQEALHNVVKHSGVKRVEVRLTEQSNQVHLMVSDSGKGFDAESTMQGQGLGLTSMRERVRLVNGTIAIESKPMSGTTIEVRVPLEAQHGSQRAS
jgi:PAS domain S-box-containing protein